MYSNPLVTNPLLNSLVLFEALTIENVTLVIGDPSAFVFQFRFLIGMTLCVKASSMSSKIVDRSILLN